MIDDQYKNAIAAEEGPQDAGWDYKQYSGPYGVKREPGENLSQDEALGRFQQEIAQANAQVKALGVPMTKGQEAALTSLTYNAGPNWINSGLGAAVRNGDWPTANALFVQYNKAGGETNPGLVRRRNQELAWMNEPDDGGPPPSLTPPAAAVQPSVPPAQQKSPLAGVPDIPSVEDQLASQPNPAQPLVAAAKERLNQAAETSPDPQQLFNVPTAMQRVRQALAMASAALPYHKIPKSIIPPLQPEDDSDTDTTQMAGLGNSPFQRRTMADGGIAGIMPRDFEDQVAANPQGWRDLPPSQDEARPAEEQDPYNGVGGPSLPASAAYAISGIPELMEGVNSTREASLAGEPTGVISGMGRLGLGALLLGRNFASRAVPEVTDLLSSQNITKPEDVDEIMELLARIRGEGGEKAVAKSAPSEPPPPLPKGMDFNRRSGLVPHMADGGSISDLPDNFEDQVANNPHGWGSQQGDYVSEYHPTIRDQAALALSNPDYPVPDSVRNLVGSGGLGNLSGATNPLNLSYSDLAGVGPAVDVAQDIKDDRSTPFTELDAGLGYAVPSLLGKGLRNLTRTFNPRQAYPLAMSEAEKFGLPLRWATKQPGFLSSLPDAEARANISAMRPTPNYGDIPYPKESVSTPNMTHGAEYPDLPPRSMQAPKREEDVFNRMHDAADVEFNNSHEAEPKMWNRDPMEGVHDNADDYIVNSSDPELDLPRDILDSYRKRTLHASGGPVRGDDDVQHLAFGGPAWYAKNEARGMTHAGPILSAVPGRTDQLPISVKAGSFVMPADVVSALGQGNSMAGNNVLKGMFSSGPFGMPTLHGGAHLRSAPMIKNTTSMTRTKGLFADGGTPDAGGDDVVPIIAAGGEFVVEPHQVAQVGDGDLDQGHAILKQFVTNVRKQHINTLKKLPPPQD